VQWIIGSDREKKTHYVKYIVFISCINVIYFLINSQEFTYIKRTYVLPCDMDVQGFAT
jgi:hypothetical protein